MRYSSLALSCWGSPAVSSSTGPRFSSVGFPAVFWTILSAKSALFGAVFVAAAALVRLNGALAARFAAPRTYLRPVKMPWESLGSEQLPAVIARVLRRH